VNRAAIAWPCRHGAAAATDAAAGRSLEQDFNVYVITDACGDVSEEAHQRAIERMLQVGARPMTVLQYLLELRRDWARTGTAGTTTSIVLPYGARTALAWYMQRR